MNIFIESVKILHIIAINPFYFCCNIVNIMLDR